MIEMIDRKLIDRINQAIKNIRLIATQTKRQKRLDAAQGCESVVRLLDMFRRYCYLNEHNERVTDAGLEFKHDKDTRDTVYNAAIDAHTVYMWLTADNRRKYKEEYRQIELLISDISNYADRVTGRM